MAGIEWKNVNLADVQKNILTGGKEGVSAADALTARSEAYQAGKSHGAARFFKGLFSLGINELWRFSNYRSYESDKAKIVNCVKDVYAALAPKLGTQNLVVTFYEDENYGGRNDAALGSTPHVKNETANVKLMSEKVTIVRNPNGSGTIVTKDRRGDAHEMQIPDCEEVRRHLEMEFMRHAKRFGKDFVTRILNGYQARANADVNGDDEGRGAGVLHFAEGDDKKKIALRHADPLLRMVAARTNEDRDAVEARMQDQTGKSVARTRLRDMLSAFYAEQLELPPEVGRTMDLDLGVSLVGKVLDGEIEDGKKLRAFLDKGSKGCHLTTAEGQKVMAQFEKAVAAGDRSVGQVRIRDDVLAPKDPRPSLPQGDVKRLHDFVADLVMNEETADYDKTLVAGKATGRRLRALVLENKELVASLMEKRGEALDEALGTLDPRMALTLKESVLQPLEDKYQKYVHGQRIRKESFVADRATWLERSIADQVKGATKLRVAFGARSEDELADHVIDSLTLNKTVREGLADAGLDVEDELYLSSAEGREQLARGFDFFAEMEKKIDASVADALKDVQGRIAGRLDAIFGADGANVVDKTADELGGMTLEQMREAYSKDPDITLVKNTLKTYFQNIDPIQKRQMLAAQTRYCAEIPGATTEGARLGALLKGAGPVMQKMLQGIDASKLGDEDFKLALGDMKDNLAPIPPKAIKAALFDLVKNSSDPKIESIEVKASLGQASVGQALLCTVKCEGQEPQECVVKLLRPGAALAAEREYGIFVAACGGDASMKATFEGRFQSIKEELDLTIEAANMKRAEKVYAYDKEVPQIGTFTNTTSARLFGGVKPTQTVMMQRKAEGTTLKKYIEATRERLADPNANIPADELQAMKDKLLKTHSALVSTSYMWANEGLFGSGFYHGDMHAGNLMVGNDGKVSIIDFGNATQLDKAGRASVTRVITGAAVGNVDIFLKGFVALLGETGRSNFAANENAIREKLGKVFEKQGLADTALRMSVALNILQLDYKIEVPGAVHNFLESQKRLSAAMDETAGLLAVLDARLGVQDAPRPKTMMQCLVEVVKQNVNARLLMTIGVANVGGMLATLQNDPLYQAANGGNNNGQVIIQP